MSAQWRGEAADAAAADLTDFHVRSGGEPFFSPPVKLLTRRLGTLGPAHVLAPVLLPWLIFFCTTSLYLYSYEDLPVLVSVLVAICGALSLALTYAGASVQLGKLLAMGVWSCSSLGLAVALGLSLHRDALGPYRQIRDGHEVVGLDPGVLRPAAATDAATVLRFAPGTFVDDRRTIGFVAEGEIFCVAPVAKHGVPMSLIAYWAVGAQCCELRRNFDCGFARAPEAAAALAHASWEDTYFRRAVELAASVYNTSSPSGVRFVRFVQDPANALDQMWAEARNIAVTAFVLHLLWTGLVALVTNQLLSRPPSLGAPPGEQPAWSPLPSKEASPTWAAAPRGGALERRGAAMLRGGGAGGSSGAKRSMGGSGPWLPQSRGPPPRSGVRPPVWAPPQVSPHQTSSSQNDSSLGEEDAFAAKKAALDRQEDPGLFQDVYIAQDGGLYKEVEETYKYENMSWSTYLMACTIPALIIYNLYYVVHTDLLFLSSDNPKLDNTYLLTTDIFLEPLLNVMKRSVGDTRHTGLKTEQVFAVLEITGMLLSLLYTLLESLKVLAPGIPDVRKWSVVCSIYWHHLPDLSTFSAMSFLGEVLPIRLSEDFRKVVAGAFERRSMATSVRVLSFFVLKRAVCAIIGFDAFLVKFRITAHYVEADVPTISAVLGAGNFLMQLMGVVKMGRLLQRRLFVFVFAGEDSVMQEQEEQRMKFYHALLAQKIWEKSSSFLHFSVIMLNFSDYDFQKLVLNQTKTTQSSMSEASGSGTPAAYLGAARA